MPRNMIVYRFANRQLLIYSAIALDKPTLTELETLGTPSYLVVPNRFHRLDAGVYKGRFPALQVLCPEAARRAVEKVVPVNASVEAVLPTLGVVCHAPPGVRAGEVVLEFALEKGRALVCCDLLFNLRKFRGWDGWLMRKIGGSVGFFGVTALGKLMLLKDRKAFRGWLERQAARTDLALITVAHGEAITSQPAQALRGAAERLA